MWIAVWLISSRRSAIDSRVDSSAKTTKYQGQGSCNGRDAGNGRELKNRDDASDCSDASNSNDANNRSHASNSNDANSIAKTATAGI
jgi:hypothetical protein